MVLLEYLFLHLPLMKIFLSDSIKQFLDLQKKHFYQLNQLANYQCNHLVIDNPNYQKFLDYKPYHVYIIIFQLSHRINSVLNHYYFGSDTNHESIVLMVVLLNNYHWSY